MAFRLFVLKKFSSKNATSNKKAGKYLATEIDIVDKGKIEFAYSILKGTKYLSNHKDVNYKKTLPLVLLNANVHTRVSKYINYRDYEQDTRNHKESNIIGEHYISRSLYRKNNNGCVIAPGA